MDMDRRSFLKAGLGATLALGLPAGMISSVFAKPVGKVREFHLSASRAKINLGAGPDFWAWTYNGTVPGPEIRVKEGETIRVVLKNLLPEETTIHWHGLPVPNAMDGVPDVTQKGIQPGGSFVYEFEAKPSGTFLYHSHVGYQLDQGLYGALIIEPAAGPGSHDREYTLMLEDWVTKDGGGVAETRRRPPGGMGMMGRGMMGRRSIQPSSTEPLLEPYYDVYAVNGKLYDEQKPLEVIKGERVKLRLINPSSSTIYDLRLAGHSLTITHSDGNRVTPVQTDILRIGMGERYDVEFKADNPGYWLLAAREAGFGEGMLRVPIKYKGIQSKDPVSPRFFRGVRFVSYYDMMSARPLREAVSGKADRFFEQALSGGMHSPYWTINGQIYPRAQPLLVEKNERIRIGYWNRSMMPHPMHLHGHFFRVVNPNIPRERWINKDTVIVSPMERLDIEFFTDNPGKWFHHCHNLYHMAAGMANVVNYVN
ncbi:multicopper oxidase domain-containing protein [Thermodesulfobacteriota bacterium]